MISLRRVGQNRLLPTTEDTLPVSNSQANDFAPSQCSSFGTRLRLLLCSRRKHSPKEGVMSRFAPTPRGLRSICDAHHVIRPGSLHSHRVPLARSKPGLSPSTHLRWTAFLTVISLFIDSVVTILVSTYTRRVPIIPFPYFVLFRLATLHGRSLYCRGLASSSHPLTYLYLFSLSIHLFSLRSTRGLSVVVV